MVVVVDAIVVEVVVLVGRVLVDVLLVVVVGRLVVVVVDVVGGSITVVVVVLVVVVGARVVVVVVGGGAVVVVVGGAVVVVGGGRVVVVVVVVTGGTTRAVQVQVPLLHSSPAAQPAPLSHCSPAPRSTTPSPHVEWRALKLARNFDRCALTVPPIVSHAGSIVAMSFSLPCKPLQEGNVALIFVPCAVAFTFAFVEPQALPKDICLPLITIGSGAGSPGRTGDGCTR